LTRSDGLEKFLSSMQFWFLKCYWFLFTSSGHDDQYDKLSHFHIKILINHIYAISWRFSDFFFFFSEWKAVIIPFSYFLNLKYKPYFFRRWMLLKKNNVEWSLLVFSLSLIYQRYSVFFIFNKLVVNLGRVKMAIFYIFLHATYGLQDLFSFFTWIVSLFYNNEISPTHFCTALYLRDHIKCIIAISALSSYLWAVVINRIVLFMVSTIFPAGFVELFYVKYFSSAFTWPYSC